MHKKTINSIILIIFSTRLITLFVCLCSQSHLPLSLEKHDDLQEANIGKTIGYFTNFVRRVLHVKPPLVIHGDENDGRVVELTAKNFSSFISEKKFVMVNFYMPLDQELEAPAYLLKWTKDRDQELEAAANILKAEVAFAKVDASMETELAEKYFRPGFPALILFAGTNHMFCRYERTRDEFAYWIRRRIFVKNITEKDDAKRYLAMDSEILLGFFDSLEGPESKEFIKSSIQNLDYSYYQTASPEVAKIFHIDPQIKRPAYIKLKWKYSDSSFTRSIIEDFVSIDKSLSENSFTCERDPYIIQIPSKQLWLLDTKSGSETAKSAFEEASKSFGSQELFFVYSKIGDDEVGRLLASKFNFTGDSPRVIATYKTGRKFISMGNITSSTIKSFGQDFLDYKVLDWRLELSLMGY